MAYHIKPDSIQHVPTCNPMDMGGIDPRLPNWYQEVLINAWIPRNKRISTACNLFNQSVHLECNPLCKRVDESDPCDPHYGVHLRDCDHGGACYGWVEVGWNWDDSDDVWIQCNWAKYFILIIAYD